MKVHFASSEQITNVVATTIAGVNYNLFTVFPFICSDFGIKGFPVLYASKMDEPIPKFIERNCHNTIMDSGLFTLMFGAHAGTRDKKFVYLWFDRLVKYVNDNHLRSICVEVDCQKVLGTKVAWELRERMRNEIPNRVINVFHLEDGRKGLDRMIEFSDYIAISVPELRFAGKSNSVGKLARYIKGKKPSIDIHLLGCTEEKMLRSNQFCTSSDSTSWISPLRYGWLKGNHISKIKPEVFGEYVSQVRNVLKELNVPTQTEKMIMRTAQMVVLKKAALRQYSILAGNQD